MYEDFITGPKSCKIGKCQCNKDIMDEYDNDKSGEIDFDEFKDMMDASILGRA